MIYSNLKSKKLSNSFINYQSILLRPFRESTYLFTYHYFNFIIAILQNNASHPICQSVKYCVRNLCRASARLQISSLSFALCQIVLPALFY